MDTSCYRCGMRFRCDFSGCFWGGDCASCKRLFNRYAWLIAAHLLMGMGPQGFVVCDCRSMVDKVMRNRSSPKRHAICDCSKDNMIEEFFERICNHEVHTKPKSMLCPSKDILQGRGFVHWYWDSFIGTVIPSVLILLYIKQPVRGGWIWHKLALSFWIGELVSYCYSLVELVSYCYSFFIKYK